MTMRKKKKETVAQVEVTTLVLEKTTVQKAYDYAISKGYEPVLESGILLFPQDANKEKITKDLLKAFGEKDTLPFSYGFTSI